MVVWDYIVEVMVTTVVNVERRQWRLMTDNMPACEGHKKYVKVERQ